jgi:hypothetical protein
LTDLAIRARGAELLSEYLDKECNNVTFITLMMAARMADDAAATCKVIEKVLNEMPIVPRELSVLKELAGMQKGADSLSAECQGVIRRAAEALRCQEVREGGVAPYLQAIHASLLSRGDPAGADS